MMKLTNLFFMWSIEESKGGEAQGAKRSVRYSLFGADQQKRMFCVPFNACFTRCLGLDKKINAAMDVLTTSSTNATDCLLVLGEIYFLDNLGCNAYCIAKSIINSNDNSVNVDDGCCSNELYIAAVPPTNDTGPTKRTTAKDSENATKV